MYVDVQDPYNICRESYYKGMSLAMVNIGWMHDDLLVKLRLIDSLVIYLCANVE